MLGFIQRKVVGFFFLIPNINPTNKRTFTNHVFDVLFSVINVYGSVHTCLTNPKMMALLKKFPVTTALSLSLKKLCSLGILGSTVYLFCSLC